MRFCDNLEHYYAMTTTEDRFLGCLGGLAVGDAVGTTLEFRAPGTFRPIDDMVGGGPFKLKPGEWTDDSSMALCLAASLVETQTFDPLDQLERYRRWCDEGYMSSTGICFDIGNTVANALSMYVAYGKPDSGSTSPNSAGNGSIMRLAPIPMFYGSDPDAAIYYSGRSSTTTHGARTCIDACAYFGGLIWAALNGFSKEEILSANYSPLRDEWRSQPLCPEIDEIAQGSFKQKEPPEIRGSGYVVRSLEAALWAFHRTSDFRSGCLLAVNLGDDADTTGAVYGQLAGAFYGYSAIPGAWREKLKKSELIAELALKLWKHGVQ
jgi:ADP-ribosyl-[dinitrogen reductase] hydrolase